MSCPRRTARSACIASARPRRIPAGWRGAAAARAGCSATGRRADALMGRGWLRRRRRCRLAGWHPAGWHRQLAGRAVGTLVIACA